MSQNHYVLDYFPNLLLRSDETKFFSNITNFRSIVKQSVQI